MSGLKKVLVLLGIAVFAFVSALPFMRRRDPAASAIDTASEQTELPWITLGNSVPLQIQGETPAAESPAMTAGNKIPARSPDPLPAPPRRSVVAPPTLNSQPESPSRESFDRTDRESSARDDEASRSPATDEADSFAPVRRSHSPLRRHKIADGDTLRTLAESYLGNGDRWEEIYRANKKWLSDPSVLPLGFEIAIPAATD